MIGWSVELLEFDIRYESRGAIKSQCLADFSTELTPQQDISARWTIYMDDSSNKAAYGAGVFLEGLDDLLLEQALQFEFKATKNQAEYEAILAGLNLTYDMGAREVTCKGGWWSARSRKSLMSRNPCCRSITIRSATSSPGSRK